MKIIDPLKSTEREETHVVFIFFFYSFIVPGDVSVLSVEQQVNPWLLSK
jgi:hypothetical protein